MNGLAQQRKAQKLGQTAEHRTTSDAYSGLPWMAALLVCSLAVTSVPIFSNQVGLSFIPQVAAMVGVAMAGLTWLARPSRIHPAVISYMLLVIFWFATYDHWESYFTLAKVALLALAVHVVVRTPQHLLVLLGVYTTGGLVALVLNWSEISEVRTAIGMGEVRPGYQRLDGTFGNANSAGMYGILIFLCGLIVFSNTRHRLRWVVLLIGLFAGLTIGVLSGSRKAMLGLLISGMASPLVAMKADRGGLLKAAKLVFISLVGLGVVIGVLSQIPHFDRLTRMLDDGVAADGSARTRFAMLEVTIEIWAAHPITGVGFDRFRQVSGFGTYSHTTFGEVLANGGLIGILLIFIFYLLPLFQLGNMAMYRSSNSLRKLDVGLLILWMTVLLFSIFSVLYSSRSIIPLCGGICGYLQHQKLARSPRKLSKPAHANETDRVALRNAPSSRS